MVINSRWEEWFGNQFKNIFAFMFGASSDKKLHASPLSKYLSPLFDEVFLIKDKYCFVYVCVNI